jgi:DNA primase
VDYLDGVRDRILRGLEDRPLSVIRVHRGQEAFMQKNLPTYTPPWVRRVRWWAESSKRDVTYALCNTAGRCCGSRTSARWSTTPPWCGWIGRIG